MTKIEIDFEVVSSDLRGLILKANELVQNVKIRYPVTGYEANEPSSGNDGKMRLSLQVTIADNVAVSDLMAKVGGLVDYIKTWYQAEKVSISRPITETVQQSTGNRAPSAVRLGAVDPQTATAMRRRHEVLAAKRLVMKNRLSLARVPVTAIPNIPAGLLEERGIRTLANLVDQSAQSVLHIKGFGAGRFFLLLKGLAEHGASIVEWISFQQLPNRVLDPKYVTPTDSLDTLGLEARGLSALKSQGYHTVDDVLRKLSVRRLHELPRFSEVPFLQFMEVCEHSNLRLAIS